MLLGFKKRFVHPIQIGTKVFTMRKPRKIPPKIGETLYMYTALRTANCEKISDKERLRSVQKAIVMFNYYRNKKGGLQLMRMQVTVDGRRIEGDELAQFVRYDGFEDHIDFFKYWTSGYKHPEVGFYKLEEEMDLFHWTDLRY